MGIKVVVGLGNPGPTYQHTRHNAGYLFIDRLLELCPVGNSFRGKILEQWSVAVGNQELQLVKPLTYMNRSGLAVHQILEAHAFSKSELLVVVDDLYLPVGSLRYREQGSAGGQRGLASIIEVLGSDEVPRLRVGVGPCPPDQAHADFVLGKFQDEVRNDLLAAVDRASQAVILAIRQQTPLVV